MSNREKAFDYLIQVAAMYRHHEEKDDLHPSDRLKVEIAATSLARAVLLDEENTRSRRVS